MSAILRLDNYVCSCCGKEYEESEMCLVDCELVCVECVERGDEDDGHVSEERLSVWDRNL